VLAAVLVLAFLAVGIYFLYTPVRNAINVAVSITRMPADLKGLSFVSIREDGLTSYKIEGLQFVPEVTPKFHSNAAFSPDKSLTVFTGARPASSVASSSDEANTSIYVSERYGEPTYVADGFAPGFLDSTHIVFFTKKSISVYDLSSKEINVLHSFPEGTEVASTPHYSSDRSLVLWSDTATRIHTVALIRPDLYQVRNTFYAPGRLRLQGEGVYEVRQNSTDTDIWLHEATKSKPRKVNTIPGFLDIVILL